MSGVLASHTRRCDSGSKLGRNGPMRNDWIQHDMPERLETQNAGKNTPAKLARWKAVVSPHKSGDGEREAKKDTRDETRRDRFEDRGAYDSHDSVQCEVHSDGHCCPCGQLLSSCKPCHEREKQHGWDVDPQPCGVREVQRAVRGGPVRCARTPEAFVQEV